MGKPTVSQIMRGMGFPDTERGPYVSELRKKVGADIERGLLYRSPGTWGVGGASLSPEERAREILAFDWAHENGYSYAVECLDPVVGRSTDMHTKKRRLYIDWRLLPAAFRDWCRKVAFLCRRPFLPKNPYSEKRNGG